MQERDKQLLAKELKRHGYSVTQARLFVCALLWHKEPQSMHELVELSRGTIDRASLYRTIQLFEKLNIVQRVYIGWKYKVELSDTFSHHHHHISCLQCGTIIVLSEEHHIEHLIKALASKYNVVPASHQLEIQGYCKSCIPK